MPGPCELLAWDSEFFGIPVARVAGDRLEPRLVAEIDAFCRKNGVMLLYLDARIDDPMTVRLAEAHGFGLVDVRIVLDAANPEHLDRRVAETRLATETDLPDLKRIARDGFRDSRFYFDSNIPDERCDALYECWVAKSVRGMADRVLVAEDARACGFVTCHLEEGGKAGRIGLIAVDAPARGRRVGETLVTAARIWFASQGAERAVVTTQARNVQGLRLYNKCGFRVKQVSLYYHRWYGLRAGS